jgi:transcriptional regulator with XRE-family HTH domain
MGRPERTISASGPVPDFAQQLRLLRQEAGLTLRQLAGRTGLSAATLSVAASGRELPTWKVTRTYVQACGADPEDWRARWEHSTRSSWHPRGPWPAGSRSELSGQGQADEVVFPGGPAPLPVTAETTREFMACLRRVKIWAGDPPVRTLARRAGLPPSTMQDFLRRERQKLPPVRAVCAFLEACGVNDQNIMAEWVFVWRRLRFAETEPGDESKRQAIVSAYQSAV